MARGEGAIVEDVDGNRFLDCAAGIAVNSTGHSHPEVVAAIVDQSQKFLHMSGTDFYYEPQVRLAEEIGRIVPIDGGVKSFFSNSGTEANEAAIKLARYHTKRPFLIAFLGSFHGRTLGSLGLTSSRAVQRKGFGPVTTPGVFHAPVPGRLSRRRRRLAGAGRRRVDRLDRGSAVREPRLAGRGRGHRRRADPGRGRLHRAADRVPPAARRAGDEARHPARRRRSAVGHGADREDVRVGALRPEAGHPVDRQGHRVGTAARRHRGPGRRHGLDARARTPARSAATPSPAPPRRRRSDCSKAG